MLNSPGHLATERPYLKVPVVLFHFSKKIYIEIYIKVIQKVFIFLVNKLKNNYALIFFKKLRKILQNLSTKF